MKSNVIRVTEIGQFLQCRRKWNFQYNEQLILKDRNKGALWFGTGIHKVLKSFYESPKTLLQLIEVWFDYCKETPLLDESDIYAVEQRDNDITLGISMIDTYYQFAKKNDDFKIIAIEQNYEYQGLAGRIDMLVQTSDGHYWIVDHKTVSTFTDAEHLEMDFQMTAYIYLLQKCGIPVRGCIYNMLRKKIPADPTILKSGGLSQAKNIDTTYDLYVQAIKDNDLDIDNYQEILQHISGNEFVKRERITRTDRHLESFEVQLDEINSDIRSCSSPFASLYPTIIPDCVWRCGYKSLCKCIQDKGDVELLKEMFFDKRLKQENDNVND